MLSEGVYSAVGCVAGAGAAWRFWLKNAALTTAFPDPPGATRGSGFVWVGAFWGLRDAL